MKKATLKGIIGDLRVDRNRMMWTYTTHGWDKLTDEDGHHINIRFTDWGVPVQKFTPEEENQLRIRDQRSVNDRFLDVINELTTTAEDTSLHLLDRIDALLELAQLTNRDAQVSAAAIRKARDLIAAEYSS